MVVIECAAGWIDARGLGDEAVDARDRGIRALRQDDAAGSVSCRNGAGCAVVGAARAEISIHSLLEGATRATGRVAIIDVFRAFTTAAVALAKGSRHRDGPLGRGAPSHTVMPGSARSVGHRASAPRSVTRRGQSIRWASPMAYQGRPKPAHMARPRRNLEISLYVKSAG